MTLKQDRISLARQQLADSGLTAKYSPATTEGHTVENDGKVLLHIKNVGKAEITVTVLTAYVRAGLKLADRIVTVEAGGEAFVGPFPVDIYNQEDGRIHIEYSDPANTKVAILKVG